MPAPQTEGQYRLASTFPSDNPEVDAIKATVADLIDRMGQIASNRDHPGARCASIAMTEFESATHWAVKAITKPKRD